MRKTQAWCPECLEHWRGHGLPVYQPLIWMLSALKTCPIHGYSLEDHCPKVRERPFAHRTVPLEWGMSVVFELAWTRTNRKRTDQQNVVVRMAQIHCQSPRAIHARHSIASRRGAAGNISLKRNGPRSKSIQRESLWPRSRAPCSPDDRVRLGKRQTATIACIIGSTGVLFRRRGHGLDCPEN